METNVNKGGGKIMCKKVEKMALKSAYSGEFPLVLAESNGFSMDEHAELRTG